MRDMNDHGLLGRYGGIVQLMTELQEAVLTRPSLIHRKNRENEPVGESRPIRTRVSHSIVAHFFRLQTQFVGVLSIHVMS